MAAPLTLAFVAFLPVTRAYFHGDDFVHLVEIVNKGVTAVLWRPYMSHLYVVPTLMYWLLWKAFGPRPAPFFWGVLLLHLLNVALVFSAVRRLTGSLRLGSLAALLWGTWPCHEGSLAWFCVHGHVIAGTTILLVLNGLAVGQERERIDSPTTAVSAVLLLVGATCFGTGIAVALVFPVMAVLCLGSRLTRSALGVLVALPAVVIGMFLAAHLAYPRTPGPRPEEALMSLAMAPWTVLSMWAQLWAFGVGSLVLGFFSVPSPVPTLPPRYPSLAVYVVSLAVAVLAAVAFAHSSRERRGWLAALSLAAAAAYSFLALGRAVVGLLVFRIPPSIMAGSTCRYHYVSSIAVILILALVTDVLGRNLPLNSRPRDALWLVGVAVSVAAFARSGWRIDLHPESREAVNAVLSEAQAAARAASPGTTVYIRDRAFEPFVIFQPEFTSAGIFSLFFPSDVLEGRHIRYVQADARIARGIPAGSRLSRLVVEPDAVPPIPRARLR